MFDINTIFAQALQQAVNARITELLQQHANIVGALEQRIVALENNPAIGVDTTLAARVTKLEENKLPAFSTLIDKNDLLAHLDQQEWFWAKLQNFVDTGIEKSMDLHLECYNHDDYDDAVSTVNDYDFDNFLTKDDLNSELRDQINDTLSNASISISV